MENSRYIAVIDCGSQTTMLIVRRIRELGVKAKMLPPSVTAHELKQNLPFALILSGGPESLSNPNALRLDSEIFALNVPMLGICYGMQLIAKQFGGDVFRAEKSEFGKRSITIKEQSPLFDGVPGPIDVWMSHTDQVHFSNEEFTTIASSSTCPYAALENTRAKIFGVQFHPEVSHTQHGDKILHNFVFKIACALKNFDFGDFLASKVKEVKEQVGDAHVIMALSGGVDSSVAAALIHQAIGSRLHCVYVNHGLHRLHEIDEIRDLFKNNHVDLHVVDARELFFSALSGITDPEAKRKIIGRTFIDVFEQESIRFPGVKFLGQGTLYPDVIESECQQKGPSHVIKSHHNVGGLPARMNLHLLEPLRELFKDEVRKIGELLGLSSSIISRQPFPGPGLAIRIPGEITKERVALLQEADALVREEIGVALEKGLITTKLWQWFAILLPVKSVGVIGDARAYGETIAIRCVESLDAMTADWTKLPYEVLGNLSSRITNEIPGISRVLYDVTQKPPGTIEWE